MKKIVYSLKDVEVKLIKFYSSDPYEGFSDLPGRVVENVASEFSEIESIERSNPIAFIKQHDGSYWLITKKSET
jgi:hypothetical protein